MPAARGPGKRWLRWRRLRPSCLLRVTGAGSPRLCGGIAVASVHRYDGYSGAGSTSRSARCRPAQRIARWPRSDPVRAMRMPIPDRTPRLARHRPRHRQERVCASPIAPGACPAGVWRPKRYVAPRRRHASGLVRSGATIASACAAASRRGGRGLARVRGAPREGWPRRPGRTRGRIDIAGHLPSRCRAVQAIYRAEAPACPPALCVRGRRSRPPARRRPVAAAVGLARVRGPRAKASRAGRAEREGASISPGICPAGVGRPKRHIAPRRRHAFGLVRSGTMVAPVRRRAG